MVACILRNNIADSCMSAVSNFPWWMCTFMLRSYWQTMMRFQTAEMHSEASAEGSRFNELSPMAVVMSGMHDQPLYNTASWLFSPRASFISIRSTEFAKTYQVFVALYHLQFLLIHIRQVTRSIAPCFSFYSILLFIRSYFVDMELPVAEMASPINWTVHAL